MAGLPLTIEGRVASLTDLLDTTIDVTIDEILTNNAILAEGQLSVSDNTLTTIATVPANGIRYITQVICSGEDSAKWDIFIDSVRRMTKRTTDRTVDFNFSTPLKLAASSVLDVKVTHNGGQAAVCEATVMGYSPI